jgi:glycerophosphoryl diester phosphodiesterase
LGFGHQENSIHALRAALQSAVGGIEFDIRLTKDRKWVAIHNPFFENEERAVKRVHEHSYMQIRREVTLLDSMLAVCWAYPSNKLIMIDVKDVGEEKQIVRMIRKYDLQRQVVVIAWEPEVLRRVHALDPAIRIGFSYVPIHSSLTYIKGSVSQPLSRHGVLLRFNAEHSFDTKFKQGKTHQHYLATIPELPLFSVQVPSLLCTSKLTKLAHEHGMKVFPFGVRTAVGAVLLKSRGADGFLTNFPKSFLK